MDAVLPRLRGGLDIMPSPVPGRPGLILRDPFRYTPDILLIPPQWVLALACFDGEKTERDLQACLMRHNGGQLVFLDDLRAFVSTLSSRGFLEDAVFQDLREQREAEYRKTPERASAHAGAGYPVEPAELARTFEGYFRSTPETPHQPSGRLLGIAAPHVSPFGGFRSYAAAYRRLPRGEAEPTFVILGTSHYGEPERFGLTRKSFVTPLGRAEVDSEIVEALASRAPQSVFLEDYCHAVEHSIEFQVVFLQFRLDRPVKIVPILCGSFLGTLQTGVPPENTPAVRGFLQALGEVAAAYSERLFWVLGIDLAHVGARYGDRFAATAHEGRLLEVEAQDRERLERVCSVDAAGFLELVARDGDPLKWCGFSPLYVFLESVGASLSLRGRLLGYEQWNIDPQSVVSFAGLEFFKE